MTIYYQHIGRNLWRRDAPRTLGSDDGELRRFKFEEVEAHLFDLPAPELMALQRLMEEAAPTGFQIWGLPGGAEIVLRSMVPGDNLLLLESEDFRYVGQVLHRLSEPCWDLSVHLWGEQRFPLIVFLQGQMIRYPWERFKSDFSFDPNYGMRGNTMRLAAERIAASVYGSESSFIAKLLSTAAHDFSSVASEFELFSEHVDAHLQLVRERAGQATFRSQVFAMQGSACAVCEFDVNEGLEAAHLVPKGQRGTDDPRNGVVLCALHHCLFDAGLFHIDSTSMTVVLKAPHTSESLRISKPDVRHLRGSVHEEALRWNAAHKVSQP